MSWHRCGGVANSVIAGCFARIFLTHSLYESGKHGPHDRPYWKIEMNVYTNPGVKEQLARYFVILGAAVWATGWVWQQQPHTRWARRQCLRTHNTPQVPFSHQVVSVPFFVQKVRTIIPARGLGSIEFGFSQLRTTVNKKSTVDWRQSGEVKMDGWMVGTQQYRWPPGHSPWPITCSVYVVCN